MPIGSDTCSFEQLVELVTTQDQEIIELKKTVAKINQENFELYYENEELKNRERQKTLSEVNKKKKDEAWKCRAEELEKKGWFVGYKRNGPFEETELKHLRVQAVGLALRVLSGNKIGMEAILQNPAMQELNPYYFHGPGKHNRPKELLRVIIPESDRKKGNKKKNYYNFQEQKNWCRASQDTYEYYKKNKPLPCVFEVRERIEYLDIERVYCVLDVWWEMVKKGFIHRNFCFNALYLGYFGDCKYTLGYIFPDSIFGGFYDKLYDEYRYETEQL